MREISKAQKTLDDIENKMKKFRSRKKEQVNANPSKAPYPDLNKYFSFLSN
jgi:DNA replication protein DnaD